MLVLSRKLGERVLIGNDIVVTVVDVRGDRVKLGFDCPLDVRVLREELCRQEDIYRHVHEAQPVAEPMTPPEESPYYAQFA